MKKILQMLENYENKLKQQLALLEKRKDQYPDGLLRVSFSNGCPQYYFKEKNEKSPYKYDQDPAKAASLAQRDYEQKLSKELSKRLDAVTKMKSAYEVTDPENILNGISRGRKSLITPLLLTDEEYVNQWQQEEYKGKPIAAGEAEIITARGEIVRSKSEKIIADTLHLYNIPYKYERPLQLSDYAIVYPDFTVLNVAERKEYIYEHFGMMDNEEYSSSVVAKLNSYIKAGFFPGDNLLITAETARYPLSTRIIEMVIQRYLL